MRLFTPFRSWLHAILRRSRTESDMDAELRSHIEARADDLTRTGIPREEALRRARLEFGGIERVKEECRESRGISLIESALQDLRFAFRMLRKSPGFTAVAVLTLALGIGANTAIFSAVNGILLEPLIYAGSSRLIHIESAKPGPVGMYGQGLSIPAISDLKAQCSAFEEVAAYQSYSGATILGGSVPDFSPAPQVSGNFFTILGVPPLLGRPILPADTEHGHGAVAVLSYASWQSDFGGDPKVLGKTILLNKQPYTVVGVMPRGFLLGIYDHGLGNGRGVWLSVIAGSPFPIGRDWRNFYVVARLKKGVTLDEANVQLKTLSARLAAAYPKTDKGWQITAASVKGEMVGHVRTGLLVLLAAVGFVLLIACINVSGLLLARGWARHHEMAIRNALGATRLRILRQLLTESILISTIGGALGLLFSVWGIRVLRLIAPANTPRMDHLRLDANVLWFTFGASVLAGILFGLAPALRVSAHRRGAELHQAYSPLPGPPPPHHLRGVLVVIEVALAVILVTGAGLAARSLRNLLGVNLGYRTDHILTMGASLGNSACDWGHTEPCQLALREMLRRIRALPGVEFAAIASNTPFGGGYAWNELRFEERPQENFTGQFIEYRMVTPGYFHVMGIPVLAGRSFNDSDSKNSQRVTIVNHAFAERYFRGSNPLGQHISMDKDKKGQPEWLQIVGEAGDSRYDSIQSTPDPEFYLPVAQRDFFVGGTFEVRTAANPVAFADAVKRAIWSVDKDAPITYLRTMDQIVDEQVAEPKFRAVLLAAFGALGLLLAMVGIYGVISCAVGRRTHEIGIRMALGAQPGDVLRMVLGEGILLAGMGIVIGIAGALALTRFLSSLLFEIKPTDPLTFGAVAALLFAVALVACYIPARRAMRVDPMVALRHE